MEKYFIITVDTEGDNLWEPVIRPNGMRNITVKNAAYIERFQKTCEKYHFIPTYLVNYEMAKAEPFAGMAREWVKDKKCEIGMHMHAWNTTGGVEEITGNSRRKYTAWTTGTYSGKEIAGS